MQVIRALLNRGADVTIVDKVRSVQKHTHPFIHSSSCTQGCRAWAEPRPAVMGWPWSPVHGRSISCFSIRARFAQNLIYFYLFIIAIKIASSKNSVLCFDRGRDRLFIY